MTVHVSLIWAMTPNRVIGKDGGKPWRIPRDIRWFRRNTLNNAVIMGRGTFASFGSKPLDDRLNIVLTSDSEWKSEGVEVVRSVSEALALCQKREYYDLFVIGGVKVYESFLPIAERLYVTLVWSETDGDRRFPNYDESRWREVWKEKKWRRAHKDTHPCMFAKYEQIVR